MYNNVQLPYGFTTRFEQSAVYDPSNTDRILTKFDIAVGFLVSSTYAAQLNLSLGSLTRNPADFMAWIRTQLLAQRQSLSVIVNGVELIPQPQPGKTGTVDAKNGPQPQKCVITALNDTIFMVDYHIIAHYWENYANPPTAVPSVDQNALSGNVLYNRWRETVTIDDRNFTKRVRHGHFQIRSDNANGYIPDQLRTQMAVVGVPTGFLRTRNEYTVTEDGLAMEYHQEDTEYFKQPPYPAFKAEGNYRVQTQVNNTAFITCSVRLHGDNSSLTGTLTDGTRTPASDGKAVNQFTLANKAVAIVMAKLMNIETIRVQSATLDVNMYDNEVSFTATAFAALNEHILRSIGTSTAPGTGGLAFFEDICGMLRSFKTPFSDQNYTINLLDDAGDVVDTVSPAVDPAPRYLVRGTAGLVLEAAAYYDPSIRDATVSTQTASLFPPDNTLVTPTQTSNVPSQLGTRAAFPMPGQTG